MTKTINYSLNITANKSGIVDIQIINTNPISQDKKISLKVELEFNINYPSPVNRRKKIFEQDVSYPETKYNSETISINFFKQGFFLYQGDMIEIRAYAQILLDDELVLEDRISLGCIQLQALCLPDFPPTPIPSFNQFDLKTIIAVTTTTQKVSLLVGITWSALMLFILIANLYEMLTNVDKSIQWGGVFIFTFLAILGLGPIYSVLEAYASIDIKPLPKTSLIKKEICIGDWVSGTTAIDLKDITIRIIAWNTENFELITGISDGRGIRHFSEDGQESIIYETQIPYIKKGEKIESYLTDIVSFKTLFSRYCPAIQIAPFNRIDFSIRVELLHPELMDLSSILTDVFISDDNTRNFPFEIFLNK